MAATEIDAFISDPRSWIKLLERLRPRWHRDAACREHPEVNFFPARGESTGAARGVCADCLVRSECLDYAITNDADGIWAGTSGGERRAMRV